MTQVPGSIKIGSKMSEINLDVNKNHSKRDKIEEEQNIISNVLTIDQNKINSTNSMFYDLNEQERSQQSSGSRDALKPHSKFTKLTETQTRIGDKKNYIFNVPHMINGESASEHEKSDSESDKSDSESDKSDSELEKSDNETEKSTNEKVKSVSESVPGKSESDSSRGNSGENENSSGKHNDDVNSNPEKSEKERDQDENEDSQEGKEADRIEEERADQGEEAGINQEENPKADQHLNREPSGLPPQVPRVDQNTIEDPPGLPPQDSRAAQNNIEGPSGLPIQDPIRRQKPSGQSSTRQNGANSDNQFRGHRRHHRNSTIEDEEEEINEEYTVVMEFEERDKNILKCPLQIQMALEASTIRNIPLTNLKQNHLRGMLIFFVKNEHHANIILSTKQFGNKEVSCRLSKDSTIQKGVIGPISCPREKVEAENKIKAYMLMMSRAGNPVKSMQWIFATGDNGQQRITDNMLIEFEDTIPPDQVYIAIIPYKVRTYIKEPTQCYNCQHFGHVTKHCHAKQPRCVFCGERGHRKRDRKCRLTRPRCCNCGGSHQAYSKICPEYKKERRALVIKAKTNTTIFNARELANKRHFPQFPRQRYDSTATDYSRQRRNSTDTDASRQRRDSAQQEATKHEDHLHRRQGFSYANAISHNRTRGPTEVAETASNIAQEAPTSVRTQHQQPQDDSNLRLPPGLSDRPKPQRTPKPSHVENTNNSQRQQTSSEPTHSGWQAKEINEKKDAGKASDLQMEVIREIMIQALKILIPKFIEVLYSSVFAKMPGIENHPLMEEIDTIINEYFNLDKVTPEETGIPKRVDKEPPEVRPSTRKPQEARFIAGQRRTSKNQKKTTQPSA